MKVIKKVSKMVEQEIIKDIICNKCGETCDNSKRYYKGKDQYYEGLENVEVHGGFYSKFFGDMQSVRFSLCEECLWNLTKTFKIPPEQKGRASSEYVPKSVYDKKDLKLTKENEKDWIIHIKHLCATLGKKVPKGLSKMNSRQMYDLYYKIKDNT